MCWEGLNLEIGNLPTVAGKFPRKFGTHIRVVVCSLVSLFTSLDKGVCLLGGQRGKRLAADLLPTSFRFNSPKSKQEALHFEER